MSMEGVADAVRRSLRRHGWDVGRYDPRLSLERWLTAVVVPDLQIDCVLDVGANVGAYGRKLRRLGYQGRIVSFEPVPSNLAVLQCAAAADGDWQVYPYALGAQDGTAEINVTRGTVFSSFRQPTQATEAQFESAEVVGTVSVPVHRLDAVFDAVTAGLPRGRVYLKIDTQGFDLEVLHGAAGCLDYVPAAQAEFAIVPLYEGAPNYQTALSEWARDGYTPTGMWAITHDERLRMLEFDCMLVRDRKP